MSQVYVYGANPFDGSPSSNALHKQLKEAGFKLSDVSVLENIDDLPVDSHVLCFGSVGFRELTGSEVGIKEARGTVWLAIKNDVLVFPTYAPGYLYRNPELMWQWKEDLELFKLLIDWNLGKHV